MRPRFTYGMRLTASDLDREQQARDDARSRHWARHHGAGQARGLAVRKYDDGWLVEPGVAVDARGEALVLEGSALLADDELPQEIWLVREQPDGVAARVEARRADGERTPGLYATAGRILIATLKPADGARSVERSGDTTLVANSVQDACGRSEIALERRNGHRQVVVRAAGRDRVVLTRLADGSASNQLLGDVSTRRAGAQQFRLAAPKTQEGKQRPWRIYHRSAADETPEALCIAVGQSKEDVPTPAFSVGRSTVDGGFIRQLYIQPGGPLRLAGKLVVTGRIVEKPPKNDVGEEIDQKAAVAAWLKTPEGEAARQQILDELEAGLTVVAIEPTKSDLLVSFRWEVLNGSNVELRHLRLFGSVFPADAERAAWEEIPLDPSKTTLPSEGKASSARPAQLPLPEPPGGRRLRLLVVGLATYDIAVSRMSEYTDLDGGADY